MYQVLKDNTCLFPKGTILYLENGYYRPKNDKACPFLTKEFVERMCKVFKEIK